MSFAPLPHNPKLVPNKKTLGVLSQLARIQCTEREAAAVLGISQTLLNRRLNEKKRNNEFAFAWDDGQAKGHMSLRRLQWRLANKGNAALAIWLGKQWLGQKDIQVAVNASTGDINVTSDKQRSEIESKLARIAEPKATQGLVEKPDTQ
jgi:hypothetical protein